MVKTRLVGVEEDVEHFLERCHRLGRRNFALMHDVAVTRRKSWLIIARVRGKKGIGGKGFKLEISEVV